MGIEVLPPDVNESQVYFAPAPASDTNGNGQPGRRAIRFGLAAIKGVGEVAVQAILKARSDGGKFGSLSDMCERVDGRFGKPENPGRAHQVRRVRLLGRTRATLYGQIDRTLTAAPAGSLRTGAARQSSLFGMFEDKSTAPQESVGSLPEWPQHELLAPRNRSCSFLRYRPSAHAFCAAARDVFARQHANAGPSAKPGAHPHRRHGRGRTKRRLKEKRQALLPAHARRPRRLGPGALH